MRKDQNNPNDSVEQSKPLLERWLTSIKDHPIIAVFLLICIIIIGLGTLTDSIKKVVCFFAPFKCVGTEIPPSKPAVSVAGYSIDITQHYRTRFQFILSSKESDHFVINRLYLKYLSEYKWTRGKPALEALIFRTWYHIALSRDFSEYDLIPQTKDNMLHTYEYKGRDSDSFGVQLSGTKVSRVKVCAEIFDLNTKKEVSIDSREIRVVDAPTTVPLWDCPIPVKSNSLISVFEPLAYKVFTHLDYELFVDSLDKKSRIRVMKELRILSQNDSPLSKNQRKRAKHIVSYIQGD